MLTRADAGSNGRSALVSRLRCPVCERPLAVGQDEIVCATGGHRFPVVEGVLVLVDDQDLRLEPQYTRQRRRFDAEFVKYLRYRLEPWKVLQLAGSQFWPRPVANRFWWWCEQHDLSSSDRRRGSMQLSVLFTRS